MYKLFDRFVVEKEVFEVIRNIHTTCQMLEAKYAESFHGLEISKRIMYTIRINYKGQHFKFDLKLTLPYNLNELCQFRCVKLSKRTRTQTDNKTTYTAVLESIDLEDGVVKLMELLGES